jgi:putative nucleotidyltransferase with HDIG domain
MPDAEFNARTAAQQVELVIGRLDTLSIPPCVGAQLLTRLLQGRFSPSAAADIVESDPSLAARILSLIAQRGLGVPERGFSLRRSLDELPAREIRDTLLSVPIVPALDTDDGAGRNSIAFRKGLLLHSLAVACCAEQLAELTVPNIDPQLAYYAGLLHDIGKLALQETMPKSFARILEEAESGNECSCTVEHRHLGTDHTIVGNHLARRWRLPGAAALAIWLHHSDTVTISRQMPEARIAAVVRLADCLARQLGIGRSGSFDSAESPQDVGEFLEIDAEQLQSVGRNLAAAVEQKSKVLGLDLPNAVADYCRAAQTAAVHFARQQGELSDANCRLQSASSHLDFVADFLLHLSSGAAPIDIAEDFAVRWQKFYQAGMVCLYLAPSAPGETLEAVLVENLSRSRVVMLEAPTDSPAIPKEMASDFAVLSAEDRIDWLSEQLGVDFNTSRTELAPLLSRGRAVGAIAFELHYPGDAELFNENFKLSTSIAGAVLDLALAIQRQQRFAELFAGLVSKPAQVSEPPRQDDQRQAATIQAEDLLNALAELAAGAAHELNNPLAIISGRAQLLAEAQTDEEAKAILKQIYENAREASGIIEDLMSFAEPPQPRPAVTNVAKMLDEAVQLTSRKTNREQLDVQIEIGPDVRDVFVDSAQIVSALANVIANAVESYGGRAGPIEVIAGAAGAEILETLAAERVRIAITDQGCGMNRETLKKATQPFFSAKPAGRKRGMGLAYAARFIQLNTGALTLSSEPGKGTTATIYLPRKTA